ncbi:MAG: hypothetical protein KAX19_13905, partial [Candidatus Brocadiae bacterium]|nr:hypothetical protein [Candidatus Brocadiia bacterium]
MPHTDVLTPRERFRRAVRFDPVDRVPYHELGFWGQTVERYLTEGMPPEAAEEDVWRGSEFWRTDRRDFVHLNVWAWPAFEHRVLEEDE